MKTQLSIQKTQWSVLTPPLGCVYCAKHNHVWTVWPGDGHAGPVGARQFAEGKDVTVQRFREGKSSIGLVGVSSMRGIYHTEGEGQGASIFARLYSTFTMAEPKACIGYAYNGHTAMIARVNGDVAAVIGWNPSSYMEAQVKTVIANVIGTKNRFTVDGTWYNDATMIHDPTAISAEVDVSAFQAGEFAKAIAQLTGGTGLGGAQAEYTFLPAEMESNEHPFVGQCTEMAVIVLSAWLYEYKDVPGCTAFRQELFQMANSQNMSERNLMQGKMMQFITRWNSTH